MAAFKRYFESNQCAKTLNTIEKLLNLNKIEISVIVDELLKCNNTKRDEFILEFENGEKDYRKK